MSRQSLSATSPGTSLVFLTASDTVDLAGGACRGLLVGTAGTARVITEHGEDTGAVNLVPLQAGYNPISIKRWYTGGTAANIWAIY